MSGINVLPCDNISKHHFFRVALHVHNFKPLQDMKPSITKVQLDLGQRSFDVAASLIVYCGGCFPELIFIARKCLYVRSVFKCVLSSNSVYYQNILF